MRRLTGSLVPPRVFLVLVLTIGVVAPGIAVEEPTATPTPTATPSPTPPPRTVAEASRQARAESEAEGSVAPTRTPIVISNENLAELASRGTLTEVTRTSEGSRGRRPVSAAGSAAGPEGGGGAAASEEESKKSYWRGRYKGQKDLIEALRGEVEALDREIPGLWSQFYAWDDPAYRDGVIKVRLDEALLRREVLAKQLPEEEAKLPEILDEARRDGALPGWFRDLK